MIKAAIFDADGTLLDSMKIWDKATSVYLKNFNIAPDARIYERMATMTVEMGAAFLKETYDLKPDAEEIKANIIQLVWNAYRTDVQLKPLIMPLLENLRARGVKMVVATSGDRELLEYALNRLGVSEYFDCIFICSEHETSKYEPRIYEIAAEHLGASKRETLVFEDAFYAVNTSSKAGFITIAAQDVTNKNSWSEIRKMADICLYDFDDVDAFWEAACVL